jgi:hypothetical protein
MADMTPLEDILNGDPADATDVQTNFQTIEGYINGTELVRTDGTNVMAANLDMDTHKIVNLADGVADGDAVNMGQLYASSSYTVISPAANFDATLLMRRRGIWAFLSVQLTRTSGNIGATEATIATIGADGRGTFSGATQALTMRGSTQTNMRGTTLAWLAADTGVITVNFTETWLGASESSPDGSSVTFTGVVLLDETP